MAQLADVFDLGRLMLRSGEGRRLALQVTLDPLEYGGQRYVPDPRAVATTLDAARTSGGYFLRMRFDASLQGPCVRCLGEADPSVHVDAREIDQPSGGEELDSPYVDGDELRLRDWAHDALALALPTQIVCRDDCRGLCPVCGADLNLAPESHHHPAPADHRWAALDELRARLG